MNIRFIYFALLIIVLLFATAVASMDRVETLGQLQALGASAADPGIRNYLPVVVNGLEEPPGPAIRDARIVGDPIYHPSFGDLWMSTWTDDDRLLLSWGDGTGSDDGYPTGFPAYNFGMQVMITSCGKFDTFCQLWCALKPCDASHSYPTSPLTDAGVLTVIGPVSGLVGFSIASIDVPSGDPFFLEDAAGPGGVSGNNDKPSSLLYFNGRLYLAGHYPAGNPVAGYLAYSDDFGQTWIEVPNSPWGEASNFRVLMFINMGQNYSLNQDGYVYGLGIGAEANWTKRSVYLARVPSSSIADYNAYDYFTGLQGNIPGWSPNELEAKPLDNLATEMQGSAIYHEGTGRFLFMTASFVNTPGGAGALFESQHPWGPWTKAAELCFDFGCDDSSGNPWIDGKYIPGMISKDAGPNHVYFTISGGVKHYQLQIGKLELDTGP